jgi:hypothetical protein
LQNDLNTGSQEDQFDEKNGGKKSRGNIPLIDVLKILQVLKVNATVKRVFVQSPSSTFVESQLVQVTPVLWIRNYLFRIRPRKSFGSGSLPYLAQYIKKNSVQDLAFLYLKQHCCPESCHLIF